ncbi:DUF1670 domain-containing protein [Sphingobacteriales bacterium CHB3]|nr:DUF1670 domain-containing protein [Sphingobacteriales bacterium CHB3]
MNYRRERAAGFWRWCRRRSLTSRQNLKLYLRGLQRDIGKGISHKVWIVGLYLEQKTYSDIERITGHTTGGCGAADLFQEGRSQLQLSSS